MINSNTNDFIHIHIVQTPFISFATNLKLVNGCAEHRKALVHIFSKKTYIQAHTTYSPCSTLILVESQTNDVGPLTMYYIQIE
jgi:hypothetical protein